MNLKEFWHKIYIDPRRRRKIRKWGLPMLQAVDKAMAEAGKPYTLVYGSLLGAVREKGFIPHDYDIDIALWADEDYSSVFNALRKIGFEPCRRIEVDSGVFGLEQTWKYKGVYIDFFFFFPAGDGTYYGTEFYCQPGCRNWTESISRFGGLQVLKTLLPLRKQTERVPFEGIEVSVTIDALAFIKEYYGPSWRTPDPSFVYPRKGETNYEELPEKIGIIKKY